MTPDALSILDSHLLTALQSAPEETRRLFHGRGRCWPGLEQLTVDWLQGVVLVSLFKEPEAAWLQALKTRLIHLAQTPVWQASGAHTLVLQHRYTLQSDTEWLVGAAVDEWTLTEGGLRYRVDLGRKQNNGLFLDMRYGRDWVRANAEGKRVLNLFAYTGGATVACQGGGQCVPRGCRQGNGGVGQGERPADRPAGGPHPLDRGRLRQVRGAGNSPGQDL